MAPNRKISKQTHDLLSNFKSELTNALQRDGMSIDDINSYNSRDELEVPSNLKPKPSTPPTCNCSYIPYDNVGQEDVSTPDGSCNVSRECVVGEGIAIPLYTDHWNAYCNRRPNGSCGCECRYEPPKPPPPTCCDIRLKDECIACPDCWWDEQGTGCQSNGGIGICDPTKCISINTLDPDDDGDPGDDDNDVSTPCDPSETTLTGQNQECIDLDQGTPYCDSGTCVECLDTTDCPLGSNTTCFNGQCLTEDEIEPPNTQCLNPGAVNYQLSPDSYLGECIQTEEECYNYLSEAYATSTPYTSADGTPGPLLIESCCCFTLEGWSYENLDGDINGDGIYNILDVVQLVGFILNDEEQVSQNYLPPYMGGDTDFECPDCPDCEECPDCPGCDELGCCEGLIPGDSCDDLYEECNSCCPIAGCTDPLACNTTQGATQDDGSCIYQYEDPWTDGMVCMPVWQGNNGDLFGQGPWDCDCQCIGNSGAPVDINGYDCNGYCGGFAQAGNTYFNIRDCNGDCININDWILYRDNPLTFTSCDQRFACYDAATSFALGNNPETDPNVGGLQIDGTYFNFSCGDTRCNDECGECNGSNDCTDCSGTFNGNAVYDGYQTQNLPLGYTPDTGGCCLESSMLQYWVDSDGDGLGDTENPNSNFGFYLLCPNNPNIISHSLVPNFLDTCTNGTIDICGCCSSTLKLVSDGVTNCTVNGCIGCMDDSACNTNYIDDTNTCDGGTCTINCTNCCIYPSDDCHNCPTPFGDGACNCETGDTCGCGVLQDDCGTCGGDNTSCAGCDGVPNSGYQICNIDTACNYGDCVIGDTTGNAGCIYPPLYYNCAGNCIYDSDSDGICDELDIDGCTDASACNYLSTATNDNGSCTYAELYYDCDGNCLSDSDGDGICDEIETGGCTDASACNYDSTATDDDGSCSYEEDNYDCDGNCTAGTDCNSECGGVAEDLGCGCGEPAPDVNGCCYPQVDEDCGCGNPAPGDCGCDLSIENLGCGCGAGAPTLDCANNPNGTHICGGGGFCDYTSCTQPNAGYDCNGNCIVDIDCNGDCGGNAIILDCGCNDNESCKTCTYPLAENFNSDCDSTATIGQNGFCIDDGSCTFALFAEPYETTVTTTSETPTVSNGILYTKGYFPFYYPFDESIKLIDIFDNIWMEDPDEYCGDIPWNDCDVSGLATLSSIDGDTINAWSTDGMAQAIAKSGGVWYAFSNDSYYTNVGNADEEDCDPSDFNGYGSCTRITKGFVGELKLDAADEDRQAILSGGSPLGYLKFRRTE